MTSPPQGTGASAPMPAAPLEGSTPGKASVLASETSQPAIIAPTTSHLVPSEGHPGMAPPPELVIALDAAAISSRTNSTAAVRRPDDPETGLIAVSSASSLSHGNGSTASGGANGNRTLYLGNLHPFVTEATLQEVFSGLDGITELKVIKDKATGMSAGYGFAKFVDQAFAQVALDRVNKCILFGQDLRINWAFQKEQQEEIANHVHVFVGDLPPDVTDSVLLAAFQGCRGCSTARVMWDHATGRSRGYGFVSFRTQEEAEEAIQTMHGQFVGARRVRCGWAQHKMESALPMDATVLDRVDPTNTNVYIGNLAPHVSDADVRRAFVSFGPIAEVKLHRKGSFGFVRYKAHEDAVRAILGMNGAALGGKTLKCSWGRHPNMPPSGVKASLMLAAAAGVAPLGLAGGAPMGTGRGAMMPPMSMLGGGGMLGMPMAATGAQGVVQGQGMGQVGMGLGMGLGGQNMQTPEGVPSMDPVHSMYALPAGYGMTPHYGGMGQVFYHGQQHPQSGGM